MEIDFPSEGSVIKELSDTGYNVLSLNEYKHYLDNAKHALSVITTIYNFEPSINYVWHCKSDKYNNEFCVFNLGENEKALINGNIKHSGFSNICYLIEFSHLGRVICKRTIHSFAIDNNLKTHTQYYLASEGGSLAACQGHQIIAASQSKFMNDKNSEPKTNLHSGKILEKSEEMADDDQTTYEMGKLIYKNFRLFAAKFGFVFLDKFTKFLRICGIRTDNIKHFFKLLNVECNRHSAQTIKTNSTLW